MHCYRSVVWSRRLSQTFFGEGGGVASLTPVRFDSQGRENLGGHHPPAGGARTREKPITAQALGSAERGRIRMQQNWSQVARVNLNALAERRAPVRRAVGSPSCGALSAWIPCPSARRASRSLRNAGNVTGQGTWL